MPKKKPVAVVPARTTAPPSPEKLARVVLADLERDLRDLLATDPDLAGLTAAELADWVAVDVADAFAELIEQGGES